MKVILRADVADVGHKGDVLDVADGYARNYLVPRGLAMAASKGALAQAESMRRSRAVRDARDREAAEEVATKLTPLTITIPARAGAEGRLFGSVDGHGDVVGELVADLGDLAGDADEAPQQGVVLDDAGVAGGIARGRSARLQRQQRGQAAHEIVQVGSPQLLGDGDGIDGLALRVERADGVIDVAVGGFVEVVGA